MSAIDIPPGARADTGSTLAQAATLDAQLQKAINEAVPWSKPCSRSKRWWTKDITQLKKRWPPINETASDIAAVKKPEQGTKNPPTDGESLSGKYSGSTEKTLSKQQTGPTYTEL